MIDRNHRPDGHLATRKYVKEGVYVIEGTSLDGYLNGFFDVYANGEWAGQADDLDEAYEMARSI